MYFIIHGLSATEIDFGLVPWTCDIVDCHSEKEIFCVPSLAFILFEQYESNNIGL